MWYLNFRCCRVLSVVLLIACHFVLAYQTEEKDSFHESAKFEFFGNEQGYAYLNFTTALKLQNSEFNPVHYRLFPRPIGQLLQKYNVAELHFTLTRGLWRVKYWGYPDVDAPTGAQVWVWFKKDTADVESNWKGFMSALSGMFCASLNQATYLQAVSPTVSFRPMGAVEDGTINNSFVRYASLIRENLCTENLTPWLKLLPCYSKVGIASLLNPTSLHSSKFLSIGLHFTTMCSDSECNELTAKLRQDLAMVFDIRRAINEKPTFSLRSVFGAYGVQPACPLATESIIKIKPAPGTTLRPHLSQKEGDFFLLDLKSITSETNIVLKWNTVPGLTKGNVYNVINQCYLKGHELQAGITCLIENNAQHNITIAFLQTFPWFLHVQYHTLSLANDLVGKLETDWLSFSPGKIRKSFHVLEMMMTLPSSSVTTFTIGFEKGFLKWTEHPPDANHGFYISPSVVTARSSDIDVVTSNEVHRIYSEALLLSIPLPDFSMPYNVICIVCTVLAIAYGSFHNLTARVLKPVPTDTPHPVKQALLKLKKILKFSSSDKMCAAVDTEEKDDTSLQNVEQNGIGENNGEDLEDESEDKSSDTNNEEDTATDCDEEAKYVYITTTQDDSAQCDQNAADRTTSENKKTL